MAGIKKFKPNAAAPGQTGGRLEFVDPKKKPKTVDPSLPGFAQFTIEIVTDFVGRAERNGYDKTAHRYRSTYR